MFPTIYNVYNDVGDGKAFYETDRVFFHSGVCQIGLSTVNFYRLHYNAFERGCEAI